MPEHAIAPSRFGGSQIHSLTAVRGLAAWWVVLFHFDSYLQPYLPVWAFDFISRGYLAVDLFFCLSGFVIFFNYGHLNFTSVREIRIFYLKRFAKIYPLHLFTICLYASLLGVLLLTHRNPPEQRFSAESLIQNLLLVQDWGLASDLTWNVPSWSISAEFAAYLMFPALVVLVRLVAGRTVGNLAMIALLVGLLNFFYSSTGFQIGKNIPTLGVIRCVAQFGIGMILAQIYLMRSFTNRLVRPSLFALATLLFLMGSWSLESVTIPLAWAALVFAVALGDLKSGFLNRSWLVFVGEISYSTYMIHYLVRDIFKLTLVKSGEITPLYAVLSAFLVILIVSVPLYLLIERPAQKYLTAKSRLKEIAPRATGQAA